MNWSCKTPKKRRMMREIIRPVSMMIAAGAVLVSAPVHAKDLKLEDWLDWERAGGAQLSPDGRSIIYTRSRVNKFTDKWDSELWQMGSTGNRHRFLTSGGNVRWSPSGDRIAYVDREGEKAQLKVRWMDAEGATSVITRENMRPLQHAWSPDGAAIAFRAEVPMKPEFTIDLPGRPEGATWTADPMVTDRLHYREDRVGLKTGFDHIFIVPADGGTPRQITSGKFDVGARFSGTDRSGPLQWANGGNAIIFDGVADPTREMDGLASNINKVDIKSGEITRLQPDDGFWASPVVSPNGRLIAYSGYAEEAVNYPAQQLRVMNIDGTNDRVLIADLSDSIGAVDWSSDNRGLYFSLNDEGSTNVTYVSLSGNVRQVTKGTHRVSVSSVSGRSAVGTVTDPKTPGAIASINLGNGSVRALTDLNGDVLEDVTLGETKEIWYDSKDGTRVQGWYVTPPDFDPSKKYPMVLSIHGGPHSMYGVNFNFRFQEFASRGYVVLYTNPRGSTGYGAEFANAIDNAYPGRADYEDLMGGVDAMIAEGFIDEDRMFATGCSGGGVLTSWIVTQTDRFKAVAALCPVINWISFAGQADIGRWAMARFRPFFWEDPTKWLEHSPIMHVQNVKTPTLLMTGDKDLRTPLAQAEEFYAALKMLGVPTTLIAMKNEYHGTSSIPSNLLRTQLYLSKWFAKYDGIALQDDDADDDAGIDQAAPR